MKSPNHIAIIMDGNGRWGLKQYNSRLIGHEFGVKNIEKIVIFCLKRNVRNLTLFALSHDNLKKRDKVEIKNIFSLLEKYLKNNIHFFINNKIKLNFIGESKNLSFKIQNILKEYKQRTDTSKKKLLINIAFNYSSKLEIINSLEQIKKKKLKINKKNILKYLYTGFIKDPEILIRTGGFSRLSDFMLWQCSYTEFFFSKKLWPDFKNKDLEKIIKKFNNLDRKFGS